MPEFSLSYIVVTRNRLPFITITLTKLLANLLPGEEIIVVDGNSNDGTKEYLQQLFEEDKIHQFISEPDKNQAHGWNKAMLMAKGTIIKKIIDDDVYDYAAIRHCAEHMLANHAIDICISNGLNANLLTPDDIHQTSRVRHYQQWKTGDLPSFTFSDVSMLVRKSSLSFIGLYDTQFTMIDWEYSLRCSYLKANIVYYTGSIALTVDTPGNVTSQATSKTLKAEALIGKQKYAYPGDRADISLYSEFKIAVGKVLFASKGSGSGGANQAAKVPVNELQTIYNGFYHHLEDHNKTTLATFI